VLPGDVTASCPTTPPACALRWRGGLVAALYGPGRITLPLGPRRQKVTVVQETAFPFSDRIDFQIRTAKRNRFPLLLRIPGWCRRASLQLNGTPLKTKLPQAHSPPSTAPSPPNDRLTLTLPMTCAKPLATGGIGLERGPTRIQPQGSGKTGPSITRENPPAISRLELLPRGPWNYAWLHAQESPNSVQVIEHAATPAGFAPPNLPSSCRSPPGVSPLEDATTPAACSLPLGPRPKSHTFTEYKHGLPPHPASPRSQDPERV